MLLVAVCLAIFVGYYVVWNVTPALHSFDECYQCTPSLLGL